ncbi:MAG: hypothetical protein RIS10_1257 [Pseudomonadota bacterium]
MIVEPKNLLRLQFLVRVVQKECKYLSITDQRLFASLFTLEKAVLLEKDVDLAEQLEAFVGRFCRLQDTLGDKLLPLLLTTLGEKQSVLMDNLDCAERFGFINSADEWMLVRHLRNQMVHEYIEDLVLLCSALQTAHDFVPTLILAANNMVGEIDRRGWL